MKSELYYGKITPGARIAIWGFGYLGKKYYREVNAMGRYTVTHLADRDFEKIKEEGLRILSPDALVQQRDFDYIILAHTDGEVRVNMRKFLVANGISDEKIVEGGIEPDIYDFSVGSRSTNIALRKLQQFFSDRKIYVYGVGRRAHDYIYMFGAPAAFISEQPDCGGSGLPSEIICDSSITELMRDEVFIVIANGNRDKTAAKLEEAGFKHGDNYCFIHELGLLLDFPVLGEHVVSVIPSEARLEDYKKFCRYYGDDLVTETIHLYELNDGGVDWNCFSEYDDVIIFDREDRFETYVSHKPDSVHSLSFWTAGMMLPSVIFARTELAEGTNLPLCRNRTDNYVEIADLNGHFNLAACCPVYFKASWYGCVGLRDFKEVWHSNLARAARLSVINRTYIACTDKCPFLAFKEIKYLSDDEYNSDDYKMEAPDYPEIVTCNFDGSCNLHCTFCREHMEFCTGEERVNKDRMAEEIENSLISAPSVKEIRLAGNGEVFASSSYQKILYDKKNTGKTLYIVTNGTLLHKADFERIKEIYPSIRISVSFGAFQKGNYEKLWRGANFEQTVKNIEMVAAMRRRGEIDYLGVYYMCTRESYLDLPDVCKWGENIGIDDIRLMRLFPKAELQGNEYYEMSLFDDNGNMLEQYREFFKSDIFTHPIFKAGNVISEF